MSPIQTPPSPLDLRRPQHLPATPPVRATPPRKPVSKAGLAFGCGVLALSSAFALQSAQSWARWEFLPLILGLPVTLAVPLLALAALLRALRAGHVTWRALRRTALFCGAFSLAAVAIFAGLWRWLHPPGIRYAFSYGQSGTWHAVQFFHTEHGREFQGPWVGGSPVRVRFPDLNHDGYPDLRVEGDGDGRIAEYVYLPQNDGHCFWHLVRNVEFQVSYPPDGQP